MKGFMLTACLLAAAPLAHATAKVHADKLPLPKTMACLQVKQAISFTEVRGLLHIPWLTELGKGSYISEREDANGVYYRAPEKTISQRRTDVKESSVAGQPMTSEGGIYVPNNPAVAPTIYLYYGMTSFRTQPAINDTDCSTLAYSVDPGTHQINVMRMAAATGIGAGTGAAIAHSMNPHTHIGYGQAAGAGIVGGLIAGVIIAAIENSKAGEILPGPKLDDHAEEELKALVANKMPLGESGHAADSGIRNEAPAPASSIPASSPIAAPAPSIVAVASAASAPEPAVATPPVTAVEASPTASLAQKVADQMGCGAVQPQGDAAYVASCGSYSVLIGCDGGQCRPLHTVKQQAMDQGSASRH